MNLPPLYRGGPFCAVRGDQFRFLGHMKLNRFDVYQVDGQVIVTVNYRYNYVLANLDEVLEEAFASGGSPTSIDLPTETWS